MVFQEVFETALRGCGLEPQRVYQSRKWREIFQATCRSLSPSGNCRASRRFQSTDVIRYGAELAGVKNLPCGELSLNIDPWVNTAVRYLGEALLESARSCLPESIPNPHDFFLQLDEKLFPLSISKLVKMWRSSSAKEQIRLGNLLADTLAHPRKSGVTEEEDRTDQPAERVLPGLFGKFHFENPIHRANCLGKALMLAAFGRLTGTHMLATVPLQNTTVLRHISLGGRARKLLEFIESAGLELSQERRDSLKTIGEFGKKREEYVDWLHMAISMRLRDGSWLLIDPNMGLTSVLPKTWQLDNVFRTLESARFSFPGLSLARSSEIERKFEILADATGQVNCAVLAPFQRQVLARNPNRDELVEMLVESDFLDVILEWPNFDAIDLPPDAPRRTKAICVLLEFLLKKHEALKLDDESIGSKGLWFIEVWCHDEQYMLNQMNDTEARTAFDFMCWKFATSGFERLARSDEFAQLGHKLIHPVCQFSRIGPGLAIPVLAHLGVSLGEATSNSLEEVLCRHAFDQFRLLYAASAPLRGQEISPELHSLAVEILRALPDTRLPNADFILSGLDAQEDVPTNTQHGSGEFCAEKTLELSTL